MKKYVLSIAALLLVSCTVGTSSQVQSYSATSTPEPSSEPALSGEPETSSEESLESSAEISGSPLDEDLIKAFEKCKLTEAEYEALTARLEVGRNNIDLRAKIDKSPGGSLNAVTGDMFAHGVTVGAVSATVSVGRLHVGEATFVRADQNVVGPTLVDRSAIRLEYLAYGDQLDCGILGITENEKSSFYANPDLPATYPAQANSAFASMKTPWPDYYAMSYLFAFFNTQCFDFTAPSFDVRSFTSGSKTFEDPFVHTHELTSDYLIIRETTHGLALPVGPESAKIAFWSGLLQSKNQCVASFYYSRKTSHLVKTELSYRTLDGIIQLNSEMAGSIEMDFRFDGGDRAELVEQEKEKFLAFDGVRLMD